MTEFVQRVNYLRAVQGELTRTIQSIDGIQAARVHLAIPEQGLFKKSVTKPKASVTLTLKAGQQLSAQQINGIQRLVAASVPDVAMQDVTLLDQHGVALTRLSTDDSRDLTGIQLDAKRGTEDYLQKKISAVLGRTFGPGEAIASVDVVLASEHGTVTTEEVLPARGGQNSVGVMVRQRSSAQDAPSEGATEAQHGMAKGSNSTETDYQVGRRVEQRTVPGGEMKRMTIAVVVKQRLDSLQVERLREVVALAAGIDASRGDAIVVNSLEQLVNPAPAVPVAEVAPRGDARAVPVTGPPSLQHAPSPGGEMVTKILAGLTALAIGLGVAAVRWQRRHRAAQFEAVRLDEAARAQMLADVRRWISAARTTEVTERHQ
jgi:flagellar M-ring protein FliF